MFIGGGSAGTAGGVKVTTFFVLLLVVLFEVISAFATVGLSTGITAELPPAGQLILVFLMFVGRVDVEQV